MNGLILYSDDTDNALYYAGWLVRTTGFDLVNVSLQSHLDLSAYECFILGSGLKNGRLQIAPWLKMHWVEIFDRDMLLYFSSDKDLSKKEKQTLLEANIPGHMIASIKCFALPDKPAGLGNPMDHALQHISYQIKENTSAKETETEQALFPMLQIVHKQTQKMLDYDSDQSIPI